jgi:hypothetical protein
MPKRVLGFMLPHERFDVAQLGESGVATEDAGFDFVSLSDHFNPCRTMRGTRDFRG